MPTARYACAAVDVPCVGVLVVGGEGRSDEYLKTAEILESREAGVGRWRAIEPMLKGRRWPSAVYFDGAVFVGSVKSGIVERLSLPFGHPGRWTLVSTHPSHYGGVVSMCVLNGQIVLSGKVAELN